MFLNKQVIFFNMNPGFSYFRFSVAVINSNTLLQIVFICGISTLPNHFTHFYSGCVCQQFANYGQKMYRDPCGWCKGPLHNNYSLISMSQSNTIFLDKNESDNV